MRAIDDKIIYKLNTTIPTKSFSGQISAADQCKLLYDEVICVGESCVLVLMVGNHPSSVDIVNIC